MIIQIVSCKAPKDNKESVKSLLSAIKKAVFNDLGIEVSGGSITTKDLVGYCTILVEVPDNSDGEKVARYLSQVFFPCNYEILEGTMTEHKCFQWQYAKVNENTIPLDIL